jgi:hypothetical protein
MPPVPTRAARLLVLASFLISIGMHAVVLQAVAWAKMTVDFARRDTLAVSLEKTFDGRHPCPICASLKKTAERGSVTAAPLHSRLGFVPPTDAPRARRVRVVWDLDWSAPRARPRALRPDSPPPKAVLS